MPHCDPNRAGSSGCLPLHYAVLGAHAGAALLLLPATRDIPALRYEDGNSLLAAACRNGDAESVAALLPYFDPSRKLRHGATPEIAYAVHSGNPECARLLLQAGFKTNFADEDFPGCSSALHFACTNPSPEMLRLLIPACPLTAADATGSNPLHSCAKSSSPEPLPILLESPQAQQALAQTDKRGATPLALALNAGSAECARILLEACAPETLSLIAPSLEAWTGKGPCPDLIRHALDNLAMRQGLQKQLPAARPAPRRPRNI